MSDVTAALLLAQLERVAEITAARRALWSAYHAAFEALERDGRVQRPRFTAGSEHNGHIYYLLLSDRAQRDELIRALRSAGIQAHFHYVPLHSSPAGLRFGRTHGELRHHRRRGGTPDPAAAVDGDERRRRRAGLRGGGVGAALTRRRAAGPPELRRVWAVVIAVAVVLCAILLVELARPRDFLTGTNNAGSAGPIVHVEPGQRLCLNDLEVPEGTGRLRLLVVAPAATTVTTEVTSGGRVERGQ